jgi:hypothetical protein
VLSAINPGDLSSRFELGFSEVHYIRMLHSWVGNIEERSISERDEILKTDAEESVKLIRSAVRNISGFHPGKFQKVSRIILAPSKNYQACFETNLI